MPIIASGTIQSTVSVETAGAHKGHIWARMFFDFESGAREVRDNKAPDWAAWDALLVVEATRVQGEAEYRDAMADIDETQAISGAGESTKAQRAMGYMKTAYEEPYPYRAYLLFIEINAFRLTVPGSEQGHASWDEVEAFMVGQMGIKQSHWDKFFARGTYLTESQPRINDMIAFHAVLQGDTWGAEFR